MLLLSQNHHCGKWLGNILIYVVLYLEHYVCLWLCGIKIWNLKVRSLKFVIWYLVVNDLLHFINFMPKLIYFSKIL